MISQDKTLSTVADLSTLWVLIDIYERDLIWAKAGAVVKVSTGAFPEKIFEGVISYLSDVLDEETRTVRARVTVQKPRRSSATRNVRKRILRKNRDGKDAFGA